MFCNTMVDNDRSTFGKSVDFYAPLENIGSLSCSQYGASGRRQFKEAMLETLQSCIVGYCPTGDRAELVGERWRVLCKAHGGEEGCSVTE